MAVLSMDGHIHVSLNILYMCIHVHDCTIIVYMPTYMYYYVCTGMMVICVSNPNREMHIPVHAVHIHIPVVTE